MINQQRFVDWIFDTLRERLEAITVLGFYALGLTFRLFKLFPPLDIPVHFMGGVVITYFYRVAIRNSQNLVGEIPFRSRFFLQSPAPAQQPSFGNSTKIFWITLRHPDVRGVQDTIVDLFVGLLETLVLSLFYKRR